MFKNDRVDESILEDMAEHYYKNAFEAANRDNMHLKAIELLNKAAGILEENALYKEAEEVTTLIEVIAKKKKEEKKKEKEDKKKEKEEKKSKTKKDPHCPASSEQAVENLKTKGWMFNANDGKNASTIVVEDDDDEEFIDKLNQLW